MKDHQISFYSYTLNKTLISTSISLLKSQTIVPEISPNERKLTEPGKLQPKWIIFGSYTQLKIGSQSHKFHVTLITDSTPSRTYHNSEEKQVTVLTF